MSKVKACVRCGEPWTGSRCIKCGGTFSEVIENNRSSQSAPPWRKHMAGIMREEMNAPEEYWWLSFCDSARPEGSQFLGAIIVRAHGITDALTKCNAMMINPGGEVKGIAIPDTEEVRQRLTSDVMYRLLSIEEMKNMGWEPVKMEELSE